MNNYKINEDICNTKFCVNGVCKKRAFQSCFFFIVHDSLFAKREVTRAKIESKFFWLEACTVNYKLNSPYKLDNKVSNAVAIFLKKDEPFPASFSLLIFVFSMQMKVNKC